MEKKFKKIKSVYNLSKGTDEEAKTAKKILDKLLKKYNISIKELEEKDIKNRNTVKINLSRSKEFNQLIRQILGFMVGSDRVDEGYMFRKYNGQYLIEIKLSKIEEIDIMEAVDFYKKLYQAEKNKLLLAFCYKHNLFPRRETKKEQEETTEEERKRHEEAQKMAIGMSNEKFNNIKKLEQRCNS